MLCGKRLLKWDVKAANVIAQPNKPLALKALKLPPKHANTGLISKHAKPNTFVDKAKLVPKSPKNSVRLPLLSADIYAAGYQCPRPKCWRASLEHQVK